MQESSSRWKWIMMILFAATALIGISWEFATSKGLELYLQHSVLKGYNKDLSFSSLYHKKGRWIIENPTLSEKGHPEDILFQSFQVAIAYSIDVWNGEIDLIFTLEEPRIRFHEKEKELLPSWNRKGGKEKLFHINKSLVINKGSIDLDEHVYGIQGEISQGDSCYGNLAFDFQGEKADLTFSQESSSWKVDVQFHGVECDHLHNMMSQFFPFLQEIKIHDGVLHGSGGMIYKPDRTPHIYGDMILSRLAFEHYSAGMKGFLEEVRFHLVKDEEMGVNHGSIILSGEETFSYMPNNSPIAEVRNLMGGIFVDENSQSKIAIHGVYDDLSHEPSPLTIEGEASFDKANLKLCCSFAGMDLRLEMDTENGRGIQLSSNGKVHQLCQLLSNECLKNQLSNAFQQHDVVIAADFKRGKSGGELIGLAKVINAQGQEDPISFGFEFSERANIKNGWFQANDLSLEKYIAPLFINLDKMSLKGVGSFTGRFDDQSLIVTYEAQKVVLENDYLLIEVDEIKESPFSSCQERSKPIHYFDFKTGAYFGSLPLVNGSYIEKNTGLLFSDIQAEVVFDGYNVHIPTIESFCHGVYQEGDLNIIFDEIKSGYFTVDYHIHAMHGKMTQVQNLFAHLGTSYFFLKVPLEGDISMHRDAGYLRFNVNPHDCVMQAHLKGSLNEGAIMTHDSNMALQEVNLNFEYDYENNILDFSDIQGTLLVGEPEKAEEYIVVGEKIHFSDYTHNRASFDIWVGDKKRDMIRLVGETLASDEDCIQFVLDSHVSHFGDVHPETFHLVLKDWSAVQEFRFEADFQLTTFLQDLQRFSKTGFLFLSPHLLDQLNHVKKAAGQFKVFVAYDGKYAQMDYRLKGENVEIDSHAFKNIALTGRKASDVWTIDQLVLDNISIAADILRRQNSWALNFLGVRLGESILLGLEGIYFVDTNTAEGKVNLLEVDVEKLQEWPQIQKLLSSYSLKGCVKGSGNFHYACGGKGFHHPKWETLLNVSLKDGEMNGIAFKDIHNVSLHYVSDRGVVIGPVETAWKKHPQVHLKLEKLDYDLAEENCILENVKFSIPAKTLPETMHIVKEHFFPSFSPGILEMASRLKTSGNLEGCFNLEYAAPHYAMKLTLNDDQYQIGEKSWDLTNLAMEYDPCEWKITSKSNYNNIPYWIECRSSCPRFSNGEITLFEEDPRSSLVTKWLYDGQQGFSISQIFGSFHGLSVTLSSDESREKKSNSYFLKGKVELNQKEAGRLISKDLEDALTAWQIGSGLSMRGRWEIQPSLNATELCRLFFKGNLEGENFECMGYRFNHLSSEMTLFPEKALLKHIQFKDTCGNIHISHIYLTKQQNNSWNMASSKIEVFDFRPSLLQKIKDDPSAIGSKNLVIKKIDLDHFQGILGDAGSFTGKGVLTFLNPPKKNMIHPLFAIPGELLSRLGLDFSVLDPVSGTIYYEIKNRKVVLQKLKDVYSQGKMSKFYLPDTPHTSYMDFEGNLDVQIKMKHNNLLFKLAELFTVTVNGNLQKPTYALQKLQKR